MRQYISASFSAIKYGSSVKYANAFRIALMEEAKLLTKQNMAKTVIYLSYYHPLTLKKKLF